MKRSLKTTDSQFARNDFQQGKNHLKYMIVEKQIIFDLEKGF